MINFETVLSDVKEEIWRQDTKWGANRLQDPFLWNTILMEEVGEYSMATLHTEFGGKESGNSYKEIVQVIAVGMQIANDLLIRDKVKVEKT